MLTTPYFPGVGGVELKRRGVATPELFFWSWSAAKHTLSTSTREQ